MDPEVIKKLAKFIPLLASEHDGEVVAAARAMQRTLTAKKLSFHDVVVRLTAGQAEPQRRAPYADAGDPYGYRTSRPPFDDISAYWREVMKQHQRERATNSWDPYMEQARRVDEELRRSAEEARAHRERKEAEAAQEEADRKAAHHATFKHEVSCDEILEGCDKLEGMELNITERSFIQTLIKLATKYPRVLLSDKQMTWWNALKLQYGV